MTKTKKLDQEGLLERLMIYVGSAIMVAGGAMYGLMQIYVLGHMHELKAEQVIQLQLWGDSVSLVVFVIGMAIGAAGGFYTLANVWRKWRELPPPGSSSGETPP